MYVCNNINSCLARLIVLSCKSLSILNVISHDFLQVSNDNGTINCKHFKW